VGDLGDGVLVVLAGGEDGVLGAQDFLEGRALRDAQQLQRALDRHLERRRRGVVGAGGREARRPPPRAGERAAPARRRGREPAEEGVTAAAAGAAAAEGEGRRRGHYFWLRLLRSLGEPLVSLSSAAFADDFFFPFKGGCGFGPAVWARGFFGPFPERSFWITFQLPRRDLVIWMPRGKENSEEFC
jgi:hypothetical protein